MQKFEFEEGVRIVVDRRRYRLLNQVAIDGVSYWQMVPLVARNLDGSAMAAVVERVSSAELQAWLAGGKLLFDDERDDDTPKTLATRRERRATLLSDKSEKDRKRIAFRRDIIRAVEKRLSPGLKTAAVVVDGIKTGETILKKTLKELGVEFGIVHYGKPKSVGQATYYKWKAELDIANDVRDLGGRFSSRGNRRQIAATVKTIIKTVLNEQLQIAKTKRRGRKPTLSMTDVMAESLKRIDQVRHDAPDIKGVRFPSKTTFYNIRNEIFSARDLGIAAVGRTRSRNDYRRPFGHEEPEACLSDVQFDETRLDIYCFDDVLKIPLGRPWLAWLVDVLSHSILGFYFGFEPPGDLVIGSVLRHACLPKSYVQYAYPDINGTYEMGGFPRFITFDNSMQAHSRSIERILGDTDIAWDYTAPRMPWLKGDVEGLFKTTNQTLLREMPGFVLSKKIDRYDYDPVKNGCIGFLHLLWIFHKWLIEKYLPEAPPGFVRSPNQRWFEGTRIIKPQFPRSSKDLDLLFGLVREGVRLDHRGILYEGLRYYSDAVDILRGRKGARIRVRVRVNPLDLGRVHVYDSDEDVWIECAALDWEYATGLDLHRHQLYRRYAERHYGSTDLEARLRAMIALKDLIHQAVTEDMGVRNNALIARALGFGTHTIFNHLAHDGKLMLGQHFAVGRMPVAANTSSSPRPVVEPVASQGGTPGDLASAPNQGPFSEPSAHPVKRNIPVFATDRSLRR